MINIYGAGISGLTVAHELIDKGFKVNVYEKNNIAGGMARSIRNSNNIPTEHSWRGYGPFYYNLFNIMKRIPLNTIEGFNIYSVDEVKKHNTINDCWCYYKNNVYDITKFISKHPGGKIIMHAAGKDLEHEWEEHGVEWHNNKHIIASLEKYKIGLLAEKFTNNSVYNNLRKERLQFKLLYNNKKLINDIKLIDYPYLIYLFGKVMLSNKRKQDYYKIKLEPLLKKISKQSYHYLVDFLAGPGYGFDKNTMSLGHYGQFLEYNTFNKEYKWQVLNQPSNEGFIDPWVRYLKSKGVKFYFNHTVEKINKSNIIESVIVNGKELKADYHIIALDPFTVQKIFEKSNMNEYKTYDKLNTINNQISFRLGFNKKLNFPRDDMGFVLIDSPYNITFYPQEDHWKNIDLGKDIKSLWSGTLIISYNKGSLYGKSATQLTKEELKKEIIHQFMECKDLKEILNNELSEKDIIFSEIFEDWEYTDGFLKTKNKKWVNNIYNEKYRPTNTTKYKNLLITGSHTKTTTSIWSMESAAESGKITANILLSKYKKELAYLYKHQSKFYIKPFKKIDDILYKLNLPNILDMLIIIIIVLILRR